MSIKHKQFYNSNCSFTMDTPLSSELYLTGLGLQHCEPGHNFGPAIRKHHYLHVVLNGQGKFRRGEQSYSLKKGDMFLIRPDELVFYQADMREPWQYAWVAFNGSSASAYLDYTGFIHHPVQHSHIPIDTYWQLIENMIQLRDKSHAHEMARTSLLYEFLYLLAESQHTAGRPGRAGYDYPREVYVEYSKEYIAFHYAHIKIQDIVEYIGVTRSYLTSIFKKVLGMSPQEYLVGFRLEKAAEYLCSTELSLAEIARLVGYEDASSFSKMFKSKYKVSPSIHRQQHATETTRRS